jgi:hypothetical protein
MLVCSLAPGNCTLRLSLRGMHICSAQRARHRRASGLAAGGPTDAFCCTLRQVTRWARTGTMLRGRRPSPNTDWYSAANSLA